MPSENEKEPFNQTLWNLHRNSLVASGIWFIICATGFAPKELFGFPVPTEVSSSLPFILGLIATYSIIAFLIEWRIGPLDYLMQENENIGNLSQQINKIYLHAEHSLSIANSNIGKLGSGVHDLISEVKNIIAMPQKEVVEQKYIETEPFSARRMTFTNKFTDLILEQNSIIINKISSIDEKSDNYKQKTIECISNGLDSLRSSLSSHIYEESRNLVSHIGHQTNLESSKSISQSILINIENLHVEIKECESLINKSIEDVNRASDQAKPIFKTINMESSLRSARVWFVGALTPIAIYLVGLAHFIGLAAPLCPSFFELVVWFGSFTS